MILEDDDITRDLFWPEEYEDEDEVLKEFKQFFEEDKNMNDRVEFRGPKEITGEEAKQKFKNFLEADASVWAGVIFNVGMMTDEEVKKLEYNKNGVCYMVVEYEKDKTIPIMFTQEDMEQYHDVLNATAHAMMLHDVLETKRDRTEKMYALVLTMATETFVNMFAKAIEKEFK